MMAWSVSLTIRRLELSYRLLREVLVGGPLDEPGQLLYLRHGPIQCEAALYVIIVSNSPAEMGGEKDNAT